MGIFKIILLIWGVITFTVPTLRYIFLHVAQSHSYKVKYYFDAENRDPGWEAFIFWLYLVFFFITIPLTIITEVFGSYIKYMKRKESESEMEPEVDHSDHLVKD